MPKSNGLPVLFILMLLPAISFMDLTGQGNRVKIKKADAGDRFDSSKNQRATCRSSAGNRQ